MCAQKPSGGPCLSPRTELLNVASPTTLSKLQKKSMDKKPSLLPSLNSQVCPKTHFCLSWAPQSQSYSAPCRQGFTENLTWSWAATSSLHDFLLSGRGKAFILLHLSGCPLPYMPRVLWSAVSKEQSCRNNRAALPQNRGAHVEGLFFCINCERVLTFARCLCAAFISTWLTWKSQYFQD